MNTTDLKNRTNDYYRMLNDAQVRATLAKYQEADWGWSTHWDYNNGQYDPKPLLIGTIDVYSVEPELFDMTDYADSCDAESLHMQRTLEEYRVGGGMVKVTLYANQKLSKQQKKLLKDLGIIQTERVNPAKPKAYNNTYLACSLR